jgi:hypothetical protein
MNKSHLHITHLGDIQVAKRTTRHLGIMNHMTRKRVPPTLLTVNKCFRESFRKKVLQPPALAGTVYPVKQTMGCAVQPGNNTRLAVTRKG